MKRLIGSTAVLLAITFVSKLIGFVRELVLLESLGIGVELDIFVVLYGLVNLLAGALGICIVTSLTPIAGQYRSRTQTQTLMAEGLRTGAYVGLAVLALCLAYVWVAGGADFSGTALLALIVPLVVPFSLLAEYQVALFLSRDQRTPVIAGNLIISLPLVAALLIFDLDIVTYAAGLAASFALRAVIFAFLLMRGAAEGSEGASAPGPSALFTQRLARTLAGGSAMLAIAAIAVTAQMAARELGDGEATVIAYGLKVPQFIITSIWFVLGTGFFAGLVTRGTDGAKRKIAAYTAANFAMMAAAFIAVLVLGRIMAEAGSALSSEILLVISASAPFLPLIVFTPLVEMVQRLLATRDAHIQVLAISGAILCGGLIAQAIALAAGSEAGLAWSPAIAGASGAAIAIALLARLQLPTDKEQADLSNANI